jgi:hypothetical protein
LGASSAIKSSLWTSVQDSVAYHKNCLPVAAPDRFDEMMKKTIMIMVLFLLIVVGLSTFTFAAQENLSLSEKEIIEKSARLEEGQKGLNKRINDLRGELKGDSEG